MNLDTHEIFGLSCDRDSSLEGHSALDAADCTFSDKCVTSPRTAIRPGDAIDIFHGLHQLRDARIVISLGLFTFFGFLNGLSRFSDIPVNGIKL